MNADVAEVEVGLVLRDPVSGQVWSAPKRLMINEVNASVKQRLLANFFVPVEALDAFSLPAFLEPVRFRDDCVHLSACIIDMEHAAPSWAPSALAPPCVGAALRVTCRDVRDDVSAVYVDTRYTNSFLTPMLGFLGLSGFEAGLEAHGTLGGPGSVTTAGWSLQVRDGQPSTAAPHFSADVFNALIASGIASYGDDGCRADLVKRGQGSFVRRDQLTTRLFWNGLRLDGDLRISTGGEYCWSWR